MAKVKKEAVATTGDTPVQTLPVFIGVDKIIGDPKQPRKHFDQDEMNDLIASVKKHGVLQAIIVRPLVGGIGQYMIVFGERRYRAAVSAGLPEIPATIRNLTDEEAFELQIVENLQRKDVHPMEEARAFRYLHDHNKTIEDIAGRVGKSPKYVAARLKLTDLTPAFQEAFELGLMEYKDAKKICMASEDTQNMLFKGAARYAAPGESPTSGEEYDEDIDDDLQYYDEGEEEQDEDTTTAPVVDTERVLVKMELYNYEWKLRESQTDLSKATFDIADINLNPAMGSCYGCKYNSSSAPLLFENGVTMCSNALCFNQKTEQHFRNKLEQAATDPELLFVYTCWSEPGYGQGKDDYLLAKGMGLTVLGSNKFTTTAAHPGEKPTWEKYYEENRDPDEEETEEDRSYMRQDFAEELERWEEAVAEYENAQKETAKRKAFVVVPGHQHRQGDIIDIILKPEVQAAIEQVSGEVSGNTLAQITEIKARVARSEELDGEKIHSEVKKAIKACDEYKESDGELLRSELTALCIYLYDSVGYNQREYLAKQLGFEKWDHNHRGLFDHLQQIPHEKLQTICNRMTRCLLLERMSSDKDNPDNNGKAAAIRGIALDYVREDVARFDEEQRKKAEKRVKNADAKIAAIQNAEKVS